MLPTHPRLSPRLSGALPPQSVKSLSPSMNPGMPVMASPVSRNPLAATPPPTFPHAPSYFSPRPLSWALPPPAPGTGPPTPGPVMMTSPGVPPLGHLLRPPYPVQMVPTAPAPVPVTGGALPVSAVWFQSLHCKRESKDKLGLYKLYLCSPDGIFSAPLGQRTTQGTVYRAERLSKQANPHSAEGMAFAMLKEQTGGASEDALAEAFESVYFHPEVARDQPLHMGDHYSSFRISVYRVTPPADEAERAKGKEWVWEETVVGEVHIDRKQPPPLADGGWGGFSVCTLTHPTTKLPAGSLLFKLEERAGSPYRRLAEMKQHQAAMMARQPQAVMGGMAPVPPVGVGGEGLGDLKNILADEEEEISFAAASVQAFPAEVYIERIGDIDRLQPNGKHSVYRIVLSNHERTRGSALGEGGGPSGGLYEAVAADPAFAREGKDFALSIPGGDGRREDVLLERFWRAEQPVMLNGNEGEFIISVYRVKLINTEKKPDDLIGEVFVSRFDRRSAAWNEYQMVHPKTKKVTGCAKLVVVEKPKSPYSLYHAKLRKEEEERQKAEAGEKEEGEEKDDAVRAARLSPQVLAERLGVSQRGLGVNKDAGGLVVDKGGMGRGGGGSSALIFVSKLLDVPREKPSQWTFGSGNKNGFYMVVCSYDEKERKELPHVLGPKEAHPSLHIPGKEEVNFDATDRTTQPIVFRPNTELIKLTVYRVTSVGTRGAVVGYCNLSRSDPRSLSWNSYHLFSPDFEEFQRNPRKFKQQPPFAGGICLKVTEEPGSIWRVNREVDNPFLAVDQDLALGDSLNDSRRKRMQLQMMNSNSLKTKANNVDPRPKESSKPIAARKQQQTQTQTQGQSDETAQQAGKEGEDKEKEKEKKEVPGGQAVAAVDLRPAFGAGLSPDPLSGGNLVAVLMVDSVERLVLPTDWSGGLRVIDVVFRNSVSKDHYDAVEGLELEGGDEDGDPGGASEGKMRLSVGRRVIVGGPLRGGDKLSLSVTLYSRLPGFEKSVDASGGSTKVAETKTIIVNREDALSIRKDFTLFAPLQQQTESPAKKEKKNKKDELEKDKTPIEKEAGFIMFSAALMPLAEAQQIAVPSRTAARQSARMMKAWRHNEINPLMGPDRDDELVHLKRMLQKSEWEKMEALRGRPPGGLHSTRGADSIALLQQQQQMKMQPDGRSGYEVRGGRGYTNLFKSVQENPWEWRRSYQGPPVAQDPRLLSVAPTVAGGIHGGSMAEVAINPLDAAVSDPDKQGQTLYYQTVKRPMPRFQDCHPSYSITHDVGQAAARVELSQRQQHQSTTNQIMHQQQLAGGQPVMHGFAPQSPPPGGYRAPAVMGTTGRIHQGDPSQPMSGFEGVIDATSHHDPYRTERGQKNPVYSTDGQQGGDYNCPIA